MTVAVGRFVPTFFYFCLNMFNHAMHTCMDIHNVLPSTNQHILHYSTFNRLCYLYYLHDSPTSHMLLSSNPSIYSCYHSSYVLSKWLISTYQHLPTARDQNHKKNQNCAFIRNKSKHSDTQCTIACCIFLECRLSSSRSLITT